MPPWFLLRRGAPPPAAFRPRTRSPLWFTRVAASLGVRRWRQTAETWGPGRPRVPPSLPRRASSLFDPSTRHPLFFVAAPLVPCPLFPLFSPSESVSLSPECVCSFLFQQKIETEGERDDLMGIKSAAVRRCCVVPACFFPAAHTRLQARESGSRSIKEQGDFSLFVFIVHHKPPPLSQNKNTHQKKTPSLSLCRSFVHHVYARRLQHCL